MLINQLSLFNLRITERFVEAFNAQNWNQFSEILTEDASYDSPIHPEPLKGNSAFVQYFKDIFVAYPDCKAETHRLFGQGNNICWEGALTGTHEGPIRDTSTCQIIAEKLAQIGSSYSAVHVIRQIPAHSNVSVVTTFGSLKHLLRECRVRL